MAFLLCSRKGILKVDKILKSGRLSARKSVSSSPVMSGWAKTVTGCWPSGRVSWALLTS